MVEVSIVIPCLNEEVTLPSCIKKAQEGLRSAGVRGEILVVDNGSTDRSVEIARSLVASVVSESVRGYGAALRRGFSHSTSEYIVICIRTSRVRVIFACFCRYRYVMLRLLYFLADRL